ncbi:alpha/beta hydrolase [Maritimibacter sp. UBA3975]|uniref:alpha/beta fold hydrolase n=1 Tax=Maritimibacter sp. UBA3975 TaxID=1946833 RepID=UPI000C096CD9|nr:alpha/beta hydrolase [Maritimibacter sp. UBA3975]MAM62322.1 alpha/beta hydrolase [Maritimibacter sp.]|tara:strand:+ start:1517 stop:2347 length:831 start_codon:yes stop_codon:yes gene_type:complete
MTDIQHFTTPDGIEIAFTDEGEGLPVIALSGLTRNLRDFDFVALHLPGVRLIRMDYRGRGQSGWADWSTYAVPNEGGDVIGLMQHLGIERAAFLGTSRGGLISMFLAATQPDKVIGVCLNDVGPVVDREGLKVIDSYIGRAPKAKTLDEMAEVRAGTVNGFEDVPMSRWRDEAERSYRETGDGLELRYDPALRESFLAAMEAETPDLWPLFNALAGKPLAVVHGAGSDVLTDATVAEMRARRPDLLYARVPGRGHAPFLDEPEALDVIHAWLDACA